MLVLIIFAGALVAVAGYGALRAGARADELSEHLGDRLAHGDLPHIPRGARTFSDSTITTFSHGGASSRD